MKGAVSVYMDSSFVLSHLQNDMHTDQARLWIDCLREPGMISALGRLEFHNMLWRKVGSDGFEKRHAERVIQEFEEQLHEGWFELVRVDEERVYQRAMGLSTLYAGELKVRALDILHVAHALESGIRCFWTFDQRQAALAERVGLELTPTG